MGDVIEVGKFIKCSICGKRQATISCDMPIGSIKNLHWKKLDGTTDYENSFKEYTKTCDRVVCNKCAKEIGYDRHICKICLAKLKD